MNDKALDGAALAEALFFLRHFDDLHDPRQRGRGTYPLDEVLLLCLLAMLAGAESSTRLPCLKGWREGGPFRAAGGGERRAWPKRTRRL